MNDEMMTEGFTEGSFDETDPCWTQTLDLSCPPPLPVDPDHARPDHGVVAFRWWLETLGRDSTILIPCKDKRPTLMATKTVTLVDMKNPGYAAHFSDREVNIAVRLGEVSAHIIVVEFDDADQYVVFMKENPWLVGKTLITKSRRGYGVWLRMQGDYPDSKTFPDFYEWKSNGTMMTAWGWHSEGMMYRSIECLAGVLGCSYDQIKWPDGWPKPQEYVNEEDIVKKYGSFLTVGKTGSEVNPQSVAAAVASRPCFYDHMLDAMYFYDPGTGLWVEEDWVIVLRQAMDIAIDIIEQHKKADPDGTAIYETAKSKLNSKWQGNMKAGLRMTAPNRTRLELSGTMRRMIHVGNGVVDMSVIPHVFKPFSKDYYSFNRCEVEYDPDAECPKFLGDLLGGQVDKEDVDLLQMWVGMCLMGKNVFQKILMIHGIGGTGKGTFVNVISSLIGDKNVTTLRTDHVGGRFETGFYHGKTLLHGSDVSSAFLNNEGVGMLKSLTGGDLMMTEKKGVNGTMQIRGDYNVVTTSNAKLKVKIDGDKSAWARRIMVVGFEKAAVAKPVNDFAEVLMKEEGSGILLWAIRGAEKAVAAMDRRERFPMTEKQRKRVEDLMSESDSIRSFCGESIAVGFGADRITSDDLYQGYLRFCNTRDWDPKRERVFLLEVADIIAEMYHAHKSTNVWNQDNTKRVRGWTGITWSKKRDEVLDYPEQEEIADDEEKSDY
jgi:P4 family phage/plasmid primase-like protien